MAKSKTLVAFQIDTDLLEKFEAKFPHYSRSQAIRNLIHSSVQKSKKVKV